MHCGGEVYAFEPNIYLNAILKKKFSKNPHLKLFNNAVGASNYKTTFFTESLISQGNRICDKDILQSAKLSAEYEVFVIDLCQFLLDEFIAKNKRVHFLKLDIEGAEFEIMDKLLNLNLHKYIDFIACETHERIFSDGEHKMQKLHCAIKQAGAENIMLDWI